ncbi:FAD-dependent oxidoreductase [Prevotella sp. S7 MS 2]|uniref:FAD-dependent oxidoreductase n=1 Tax=Prevotella sp. S7 MS 2 TaxID=1287488 RepID=UPI0005139A76|nr:FAD-dependent oxidoreductase [Prevotella sp. S7 MS 2]KGI59724.1 pyridine nucleotide-disulfide oxidoreductase [Prevotella sp. S7 MS 2]
MKHLIIGGVAGGATAAARIRRADELAEIVLIEKGPHISYANCGLPYYIGGTIAEREKLFVRTPESFGRRFAIDVRVENEAVGIDTEGKTVTIRRKDGSEYTESYDKLLLSPGSSPVRPPLQGINLDGIFTLRNVEDTDRIKQYIDSHCVKQAVVVGGGFIGLEMAENLHHVGAEVSIVEMGNQVMAPVDFSIASHVHRELMNKGVNLYLNKGVEHFEKEGDGLKVFFNTGESIYADIVLLSIGVRANTQLAQQAGIELGERGIKVDEYLETSAKDVYAVGDAIEFVHPLTGQPWLNFLANPANRQGRIVADNMVMGNVQSYEGAIGTSIAKVFDLAVGSTGLAAKRLKQLGIPYQSSTTISAVHAGYYPNSFQLTTKLTFDPETGKLYGAQCVGSEGVDKRIDQLSIIIKNGGTVADLTRLEHAYAPPFSSAKDPIAIAGYAANNIVSGAMKVLTWRELNALDRDYITLVDVRTAVEHEIGSIERAINIPVDDLRERISEIPTNKPVVVFCAVGLRGYLAQRILLGRGFTDVRNLSGGYKTYSLATQEIKNKKKMVTTSKETVDTVADILRVDACGLQCPGPILKLKKAMDNLEEGQSLQVKATDAGFPADAEAWCATTGNSLEQSDSKDGFHTVTIRKGRVSAPTADAPVIEKNKTLIMFSDDLDKALATFVLANGAAATGHQVSIFFTFWGLNLLKKEHKPAVKKDIFGRMFSWMLPSSSRSLSLSKMSLLGIGDRMMRHIMKQKNIYSLEEMRQQALDNGVEFIACQMSMDMMGIKKEELLDEVNIGGVATYMERAEHANVNLFI